MENLKMRALPLINSKYWLALIAASIFGTNTGDMISEYFHLGNVAGLPYLAVILAVIFMVEKFSPFASAVYFWVAIIVIRTAATNIADITHEYGVWGVAAVPVIIAGFVFAVRHYKKRVDANTRSTATPQVDSYYWFTMALAGIVGTLIGDFSSVGFGFVSYYVSHLAGTVPGSFDFSWLQSGHLVGTVIFGAFMAWMMSRNTIANLAKPYKYWTLLALIRTAGTAAGDYLAHTSLGLFNSTILTGFIFAVIIAVFYVIEKNNAQNRGQVLISA
jgi:uncharacterized membrane-anchored protein